MSIHIRVDNERENSKRRFRCGLGPDLPPGDVYYFASEWRAERADCPGCNPSGPRPLGTPSSELSGRPGEPGWEKFKAIAKSWGYD